MLILLFLSLLIVGFALNVLLLYLITKFFKIEGLNFKKNLIITIFYLVAAFIISFVIGILLTIAGLGHLTTPLTLFIGFAVFHKLFIKYYKTNLKKNLSVYIAYILITVFLAIPIRGYIFEPFYAKGDTMNPTYQDGDYLIINKFSKNYQRGDVIVFLYPLDHQQFFIKRIVGLPGEKIQIKDESVIIYDSNNPNGKILNEPYLANTKTYAANEDILELSNSEYYVLGDNRGASKDSRVFGAVDKSLIRGKIWFKGY